MSSSAQFVFEFPANGPHNLLLVLELFPHPWHLLPGCVDFWQLYISQISCAL